MDETVNMDFGNITSTRHVLIASKGDMDSSEGFFIFKHITDQARARIEPDAQLSNRAGRVIGFQKSQNPC